jgi:hypothetical protein
MTLNKKDWARLQWSVILFVSLAVAGAAVVGISTKMLGDAEKTNRQSKQERDTAHSKAARASEEAQELREKIAAYQTLEARGIIGQEHRLDWIEKIRKIKKARKLIDVTYELGPQQPIANEVVPSRLNGFEIMSSPMQLQISLLHENDLLDFLADLRAGIKGYIRIRECELTRTASAAVAGGPTPLLRADCVLGWITIREAQ